jgi:hypothetical protein
MLASKRRVRFQVTVMVSPMTRWKANAVKFKTRRRRSATVFSAIPTDIVKKHRVYL